MPKKFRGSTGCSKPLVTYLILLMCLYLSKKKGFYLQREMEGKSSSKVQNFFRKKISACSGVKCSVFGEILVPRDHPAFPVGILSHGSFQLCCHEKVVQKWCSQISLESMSKVG